MILVADIQRLTDRLNRLKEVKWEEFLVTINKRGKMVKRNKLNNKTAYGRIKSVIQETGLRQKAFAEHIGKTAAGLNCLISNLKHGHVKTVPEDYAYLIETTFGYSGKWLRNGKGQRMKRRSKTRGTVITEAKHDEIQREAQAEIERQVEGEKKISTADDLYDAQREALNEARQGSLLAELEEQGALQVTEEERDQLHDELTDRLDGKLVDEGFITLPPEVQEGMNRAAEEMAKGGVSLYDPLLRGAAVYVPTEYNMGEHELIDVIEAWGLNFHLGNVVKYILQGGFQGKVERTEALEALEQAHFYLTRYIQNLKAGAGNG